MFSVECTENFSCPGIEPLKQSKHENVELVLALFEFGPVIPRLNFLGLVYRFC